MTMQGLVEFDEYDDSVAKQEQKEVERGKKTPFLSLKEGQNVLRVLPGKKGSNGPFKVRWRHWINLPNGESVQFNCPQKMAGQPCEFCDQSDYLNAQPDKASRDKAFALSASRRALCVVIDRTDPDAGPQVFDMPATVYDQMVEIRNSPTGNANFIHPVNGFDLIVTKSGKGKKKTRYTVQADRQNSPLHTDVAIINDWILNQPDLGWLLEVKDMMQIQADMTEKLGGALPAAPAPAPAPMLGAAGGAPASGRVPNMINTTAKPAMGVSAVDDIASDA